MPAAPRQPLSAKTFVGRCVSAPPSNPYAQARRCADLLFEISELDAYFCAGKHFPSRFARALIAKVAFSAAMALPAWCSSQNPTIALARSRTRMMPKSGQCRAIADRITAASIIHGIGAPKITEKFQQLVGLLFYNLVGPYWVSRFVASAWLRPSGDDPNFFSTSASGRVFRSSFASRFDPGSSREPWPGRYRVSWGILSVFAMPRRSRQLRDTSCRTDVGVHRSIVFATARKPSAPGSMLQSPR